MQQLRKVIYGIPKYTEEGVDMPIILNGQNYYRTTEVCRIVGISRNTLFRWLREGSITDVEYRDCRGWRLFTQDQVDTIKKKTLQISTIRLHHTNEQSTDLNQSEKASNAKN